MLLVTRYRELVRLLVLLSAGTAAAMAGDQPQWGQWHSRNMVSDEVGLPEHFDPATGENIKWSVPLGSQTYSSPIVADGHVFLGTNSVGRNDIRHAGSFGVLLCLDEADGRLCWQLVVPKLPGDALRDWPGAGFCSPPTVEDDRVYVVSNRAEVLCLDRNGLANGNDGPYRDEAQHATPLDQTSLEPADTDADILWLFDMWGEGCMYPHDSAHSSILMDGNYLYVNTGNGVDNTHHRIRAPAAPSLIVLDKRTGRLVAQDGERIGPRIFHATWSSPALGVVNGQRLIFFCGGDGICYAFKSLPPDLPDGPVRTLERVWRFDCDPTAPKEKVHDYIGNRVESPSNVKSMPVFHNNRVYVTVGGDIWWGKRQSWLQCIDATGTGDLTKSGLLWSCPLERHCCSTPAIKDGLAFVADCGRVIHCVDAMTGQTYWKHETDGDMWGSTLVADGKVYVGTKRRSFWILAANREKQVLAHIKLDGPICGTPTAANGVLFINTFERLYAVQKNAHRSTTATEKGTSP